MQDQTLTLKIMLENNLLTKTIQLTEITPQYIFLNTPKAVTTTQKGTNKS